MQKVYKNKKTVNKMTEKKGVAYILGIISIVLAFFQPVAAIIFGIIGLVQNKEEKSKKAKKLNIIGIVLGVIVFAVLFGVNLYLAYKNLSQGGFPVY